MEEYIFPFKDKPTLKLQDDTICMDLYKRFWEIVCDHSNEFDLPQQKLQKLKGEFQKPYFVATYASVVLTREINKTTSFVWQVGLDGWTRIVHGSILGREQTAVANVRQPTTFQIGHVLNSEFDDLWNFFMDNLDSIQENNVGNMRRSHDGHQGNQKTPSFLHSLLSRFLNGHNKEKSKEENKEKAISDNKEKPYADAKEEENQSIQGGTTDVGLHTGCLLRNTSFPLVQSVVYIIFRQFSGEADDELFNKVIVMIREISVHLNLVKDKQFKRKLMVILQDHHVRTYSLEYPKPPVTDESTTTLHHPDFPKIPSVQSSVDGSDHLTRSKTEAKRNIGWTDIMSLDRAKSYHEAWITYYNLCSFFWNVAALLEDPQVGEFELREKSQCFSTCVQELVQSTIGEPHVMTVILTSSELLVYWICYCCAHRIAEKHHPLLHDYSVALEPDRLKHLVLADKNALDSVDYVISFLRLRAGSRKPFRNQDDTMHLAQSYGRNDEMMGSLYQNESAAAKSAITDRWETIKQTQKELHILDNKLQDANRALEKASYDFSRSKETDFEWVPNSSHRNRKKKFTSEYYFKEDAVTSCEQTVNSLKNQIKNKERKPPNLLVCLPEDRNSALTWIFFFYMPEEFRYLAYTAQKAEIKLFKVCPQQEDSKYDIINWYTQYQRASIDEPLSSDLFLATDYRDPSIPTPNIRQYTRDTGVFFPDFLVNPSWNNCDPFSFEVPEEQVTHLFTEILTKEPGDPKKSDDANESDDPSNMQRFLCMNLSKKRENEAIVQHVDRPEWLSHEQCLYYANLRAHPNTQIRNFIECLTDNLLPFQNVCVHIIVKQLLFEVGHKSWKTDLMRDWNGHNLICNEMKKFVSTLKDSPKDCNKMLIVGCISAFFGQHQRAFRAIARDVSCIARKWGADLDTCLKNESLVTPELYWKQAKYYAIALMCYFVGNLEKADFLEMSELIVLFKNRKLFASDYYMWKSFDQSVAEVMGCRIKMIMKALHPSPNHLSKCLSLVVTDAGDGLTWSPVKYDDVKETGCYEAMSNENRLYSINLLNGNVLVDGAPPGFLPKSITSDPIYTLIFGSRNFEVVSSGFQRFRTSRQVDDNFYYEFIYNQENQLQIVEFAYDNMVEDQTKRLVLLRREEMNLPVMIRDNHSHWYSKKYDVVLVRKTSYCDRKVCYVVTNKATYCVPMKDQNLSFGFMETLLPTFDQLQIGSTPLLRTLSRVEKEEYIHITEQDGTFLYSLPRFKLSFKQIGDVVHSVEFKGFWLECNIFLEDTLPGLTAYLMLQNKVGQQKVIIRGCKVTRNAVIKMPSMWFKKEEVDESNATRKTRTIPYYVYDVHRRFQNLVSVDNAARLHLAALYTSGLCLMPDKRLGKPGADIATNLVRQCWKNEPLSSKESENLIQVSQLSVLSPSLKLVCSWLWMSSEALEFLHESMQKQPSNQLEIDSLSSDEYSNNEYCTRLLAFEARLLFGMIQTMNNDNAGYDNFEYSEMMMFVVNNERLMQNEYIQLKSDNGFSQRCPLEKPNLTCSLEKKLYADLEASYNIHHQSQTCSISCTSLAVLQRVLLDTTARRKELETSLLKRLNEGDSCIETRFSQITGMRRLARAQDLLCLLYEESELASIVPSTSERRHFMAQIMEWEILCVFEDKLHRIKRAFEIEDLDSAISELQCIRNWNPFQHPRWLSYEVEQQLQIRPEQYEITRQLLEEKGSTIQLSMGLGKTRVIVPMIILESISRRWIPRINVLPQIIDEAIHYYRSTLGASVQKVCIFSLPFNRDVPLDADGVDKLSNEIAKCYEAQGCFVVTPQHRNSLLLKQHEEQLFITDFEDEFKDVIDESDAILHHDFQLVYALGDPIALDCGPSRWSIFEEFIISLDKCPDLKSVLSDHKCVHFEGGKSGTFSKIRLLSSFQTHAAHIGKALCWHFVNAPPAEFHWLKHILSPHEKARLVDIMSDPSISNSLDLIDRNPQFKRLKAYILAIRACIAYGLLFHALSQRYRVTYGLHLSNCKRRMAVPYSASDTPKLRAEYSHPDMAIILTILSYFHEGLSKAQFVEALECLYNAGLTAQEKTYGLWVESVHDRDNRIELEKFDTFPKVDIDNKIQIDLMYPIFKHSMVVICYWLNNCVFPSETFQFPSARATNAWNLVDSKTAIGFSGTDDNKLLMPTSIKQISSADKKLQGTNAASIDLIIESTKDVIFIDAASEKSILWQLIVKHCVDIGAQALIDVGGLMAGSNNKTVALYLAEHINSQGIRGVLYFDIDDSTWNVYDIENDCVSSYVSSSLFGTTDCFVFFDESRCRGADMKLKTKAIALVTLEPDLTKDKFLQGCTRMRKLGSKRQTLVLAGTNEMFIEGPPLGNTRDRTTQIINRVMANTVRMVQKGLFTFYERGMQYQTFPTPINSNFSLDYMYGTKLSEFVKMNDYLDSTLRTMELSQEQAKLLEYCKELGTGMEARFRQTSGECERELEEENEEEDEEELERPKIEAALQSDWDFEQIFVNPAIMFENQVFRPLGKCLQKKMKFMDGISWSKDVFCTSNFWKTIQNADSCGESSRFLRSVNPLLVMSDGRVVLISNYELDKILPYWWAAPKHDQQVIVHSLSAVLSNQSFGNDDKYIISPEALVTVKLFRGLVKFSAQEQQILVQMFRNLADPRVVMKEFLLLRGRLLHLDKSELDVATLTVLACRN